MSVIISIKLSDSEKEIFLTVLRFLCQTSDGHCSIQFERKSMIANVMEKPDIFIGGEDVIRIYVFKEDSLRGDPAYFDVDALRTGIEFLTQITKTDGGLFQTGEYTFEASKENILPLITYDIALYGKEADTRCLGETNVQLGKT
jgi:hypothetical protein